MRDAVVITTPRRARHYSACGEVITIEDFDAYGPVESAAWQVAARGDITHIVATSENDLIRAAAIRSAFDLPGQRLDSALAYRDKVRMKERLQGIDGLTIPQFRPLTAPVELAYFRAVHPGNVVVKPRDGMGSVGARVIRTDEDCFTAQREFVAGLEVEEFMAGDFYHVDGFQIDGNVHFACASKYFQDGLSYLTGGYNAATMLPPSDPLYRRLCEVASQVVSRLPHYPAGSFHLELFHRPADERIAFCEIAARTGGGPINSMVHAAFDVDLNREFVRAMGGLPLEIEPRSTPTARLAHGLVPARLGTVAFVDRDRINQLDGVRMMQINADIGTSWHAPLSSVDCAAQFILEVPSDSAELVLKAALDWVAESIRWQEGS